MLGVNRDLGNPYRFWGSPPDRLMGLFHIHRGNNFVTISDGDYSMVVACSVFDKMVSASTAERDAAAKSVADLAAISDAAMFGG